MQEIALDTRQVDELANFFVGMADSMREFYENPQNAERYREWHLKKYGCLPEVQNESKKQNYFTTCYSILCDYVTGRLCIRYVCW